MLAQVLLTCLQGSRRLFVLSFLPDSLPRTLAATLGRSRHVLLLSLVRFGLKEAMLLAKAMRMSSSAEETCGPCSVALTSACCRLQQHKQRAAPAVQDYHIEWRHLPGCRCPGHCLLIKNHPGKEKKCPHPENSSGMKFGFGFVLRTLNILVQYLGFIMKALSGSGSVCVCSYQGKWHRLMALVFWGITGK